MFCIQHPHQDHQHHNRILHSFRSHKSLKAEAEERHGVRHHHRQPSDASSVSRSSAESSRPSTSRIEVEWDPLRLHPPLAPSPVLPSFDNSRRYEPQEIRQARSMHNLAGQNHHRRAVRSHSEPSVVIYDGFDFGFSQASLRASLPPSSSSGSSSGSEFGDPATPNGRDPVVTPRLHPGGRTDGPDYFMKRGDWKRRGIVFGGSESAMATEEESFDLDVDFL